MRQMSTKTRIKETPLYDRDAERTIISCLLKDADKCFYDVDALIQENDFQFPENRIIYSTIKNLILKDNIKQPDIHTIGATIAQNDKEVANKFSITEYLSILHEQPVQPENIGPFTKLVKKFALRRQLKDQLLESITELEQLDSAAEITEIIAAAEKPVINFTQNMMGEEQTVEMNKYGIEFLRHVAVNKPANIGIPSGYPRYDQIIGGGFRPGVHLFAGRAKSRKSMLGINIINNVTAKGIKVLYLDTELSPEAVTARWLGMVTGAPISSIEDGSFTTNEEYKTAVKSKLKDIDARPFWYHNISGKDHYSWISVMRRWLFKEVGIKDGNLQPCLIVLDYIKMMDLRHAGAFAEHQLLGQQITDLHNFCLKYKVAIVAMCQLNREGITREDQGILAGSDKLIGLCSSAFLIKVKTPEDLVNDSEANGDRKLVPLAIRFGQDMPQGEYINVKCDPLNGRMVEGLTNFEISDDGKEPVSIAKSNNKPHDLTFKNDDTTEKVPF